MEDLQLLNKVEAFDWHTNLSNLIAIGISVQFQKKVKFAYTSNEKFYLMTNSTQLELKYRSSKCPAYGNINHKLAIGWYPAL